MSYPLQSCYASLCLSFYAFSPSILVVTCEIQARSPIKKFTFAEYAVVVDHWSGRCPQLLSVLNIISWFRVIAPLGYGRQQQETTINSIANWDLLYILYSSYEYNITQLDNNCRWSQWSTNTLCRHPATSSVFGYIFNITFALLYYTYFDWHAAFT